ncbi:MAG: hypothetical protein K9I94_09150 [Bacteroidales bacterium]|nr:hypothetical protein [Bacteroidales bacterium]
MQDNNNNTDNKNPSRHRSFLARGCCHIPNLFDKKQDIYRHGCSKLDSFNWLEDIVLPDKNEVFDCIEVRFKNSRKDFFRFLPDMNLNVGDIVAVEASPGHDIGIVSLMGEAVRLQMRKKGENPASEEIKKIYRKARLTDIEKWISAVEKEDNTMIKARKIAAELDLQMKINDVEYQGDNTKAIFYYTAEDRVDFRQLIKILAEKFKVRIEMRQIGVRQEAGRLGGIGSCGRELCCATWITDFHSVTTNAARTQQLTLNPQKLAGQCGKLKCCLNYEYPVYADMLKEFPNSETKLQTKKGNAVYQKADVIKKMMWYSYDHDESNLMAIEIDKVRNIMKMNKNGKKPDSLEEFAFIREKKNDFINVVGQDDLNRFDK